MRDTYFGSEHRIRRPPLLPDRREHERDGGGGLSGSTWQVQERYVYDPYGAVTVYSPDWTTTGTSSSPRISNTLLYASMVLDPADRALQRRGAVVQHGGKHVHQQGPGAGT